MERLRENSVLLYDGLCGFCDGAVQFLLVRDKIRTLRFAPLQGDFAQKFFERHPELRNVDSIILVQPATIDLPEVIAIKSSASVALGKYLGGVWTALAVLFGIVPRMIRDFGYDLFARIRYRIFGTRESCRIPSIEDRLRFID